MAGHTRHCQYALFVCLACLLASCLPVASAVVRPCVSFASPGSRLAPPRCLFTGLHEDTGGSRDTRDRHKNLTNQPHETNPTHRLTRQTTPEPRDARVATHHAPLTRSSAVVVTVMATAPDGIGDGTPPRPVCPLCVPAPKQASKLISRNNSTTHVPKRVRCLLFCLLACQLQPLSSKQAS